MGEETIEENVESDVASRSSVDSSFDRVGLLDDRFEIFGALKKKYKVAKGVTLTLPHVMWTVAAHTHTVQLHSVEAWW